MGVNFTIVELCYMYCAFKFLTSSKCNTIESSAFFLNCFCKWILDFIFPHQLGTNGTTLNHISCIQFVFKPTKCYCNVITDDNQIHLWAKRICFHTAETLCSAFDLHCDLGAKLWPILLIRFNDVHRQTRRC